MKNKRSSDNKKAADLLEKRIRSSRRALMVERLWPCVWPPLAVALFFTIVSLLGLWTGVSGTARHGFLGAFGLAALLSLIPLARISSPTREEAVRRLERKSGVEHRPASAYDDSLTGSGDADMDRQSRAIWQAHRDRLAKTFNGLRPGAPEPRVDKRDPFALRAALLIATAITTLLVWPVAGERLYAVFAGPGANAALNARLDAWVTPPHYTGRAPIMLADGSVPQKTDTDEARLFEVPTGSTLVIRASGLDRDDIQVSFREHGAKNEMPIEEKKEPESTAESKASIAASKNSVTEFGLKLTKNGVVSLALNESRLKGWQFNVTPDNAPEIELTKPAGRSARGALSLNYRITDDYGILSAEAQVALTQQSRESAGITADDAQSPWPAPKIPLRIPRRNKKKVDARIYKDLTAHPWAGLEVAMTLSARDQVPQVGRSESYVFELPAREFRKPLAKAIVEQRRNLAINPAGRAKVATALNALTIAPELFTPDRTVYLGLRSAYWRINHHDWFQPGPGVSVEDEKERRAATNKVLKGLVDQLWDIALRVEDGDLSQAERDLRDAQDKLAEALQNGTSEEEISRLMKELRQAMNRFMRSMQQQARQQGNQQQAQRNPNSRQLSQRDLDKMMSDIEKLAKSGNRDAAQQMLEQLRNMMEQLQTAQSNPQSGRMQQTMREFGDLIRDQQRLLDDTFNARQGKGRDGKEGRKKGQRGKRGEGQQGKDGSGRSNGLSQRQGSLKNNLGRLLDSLQGFGGQTPKQLEQAQRAMRGAQQSLEKGDLDRATRQQGKALDQLRQGTREMAQEMLKGMAGQVGQRPRDPFGRSRETQNNGQQTGEGVKIPGEIDVQRARRILEELRRRSSDPNRPSLELDYIERLLERF